MTKKDAVLSGMKKGDGQLTGPAGKFPMYTEGQTSCSLACPAGVDIKAYVNLIADRKYEDAVTIIRMANPFPGICGRVCTHPCESECGRKNIDEPVSIKSLKRFAADYELSRKKPGIATEKTHSDKIAIIGSGPAGLTAASDLAFAGFDVTVFDASKEAGGLMAWGIPDFRLPKNIVRSEVRDIQALGVEIVTGKKVEKPHELLKKGFSAVIMAMGCQISIMPGIPGEDSAIDCLKFLREVSEGQAPKLGKNAIVIGGGNAALDSARTALRLGASVTVAYRRTEEEMPADPEEIAHAKDEGVRFEFLAIPIEIIPGKSMRFQRAKLGEPDASGRRSPVPIPDDFFTLEADSVIMAIGSKPDASAFPKDMKLTKRGTPEVGENRMTSVSGLFTAGDLATGPSTIVDAIGSGHDTAASVMEYLLGEDVFPPEPREMLVVENPPAGEAQRCASCFIPLEKRRSTFDEAEVGMAEREAITEALRCQRCGSCDVCDVCLAVCDYRNAMVTVPATGERALAKVPFDVARSALDSPENWAIELGRDNIPVTMESLLARADENACIACGKCEEACPYKAIRTVFDANGNAHAVVELSACRGCGACAGACPTGAIFMGYMGDDIAFSKIRDAVRESKNNDGIVRFSCMWNKHNRRTEAWPWEVKAQCTRRLSPAMLLETLALGAKGVSVLGCEDDECHYLPGPWMGPDVVDATKNILGAISIDPRRVAYIDTPDSIEEFMGGITLHGPFKPCADRLPQVSSGIGRCLNAAQVLMAQPDNVRETSTKCKTLLAYGCLAMSEPVFAAYGIQNADVLGSAMALLKKAGVGYEMAHGVHTTGAGLKEWGMDDLHKTYMDSIHRELKKSGASKLIVPTPKSFEAFKAMKPGCEVASLPGMLKGKLSGKFIETPGTVAYHPACSGMGGFDCDCLELLREIPGLKLIEAEGKCGDSGWKNADSKARDQAKALLGKAEKSGAHTLVAGSPRCAAHLRAITGGWNTSPVKVMDIYTFLASRLGGEE